jgi:DNA mismatch repair ATPase MutS
VGNDVEAVGRRLLVVTGANSGGKSTFLRSLGVAQLMLQAGMFVAAQEYSAGLVSTLQTHFVRGEQAGLDSGRLDSDLARLAETAGRLRPRALLLLNEPLSGTNEAEGSEIGRQVITALLEAEVTVILVSHFFTLATGIPDTGPNRALYLRAERLEDGRRTFRIRPGYPEPSGFGADLLSRFLAALAQG